MSKSYVVAVLALLTTALVFGCIGGQNDNTSTTLAATPSTEPSNEPTVGETKLMAKSNSELGQILVDGKGMTLYRFNNDEKLKSNCYDQCAINWPPLQPIGLLGAGEGVIGSIAVIDRTDGLKQITYNGIPLYYFASDKKAGDVNGQGVNNVWFIVHPDSTFKQSDAPVNGSL